MKVKELVKTLIKFDPEAQIYYRIDPTIKTQYTFVEFVEEGGKRQTIKVGDFELFGHTHPNQKYPYPSNTDLKILTPLRPEFIVAQSGKAIIMNIEDYDKWDQYKRSDKKVDLNWTESKRGRDFIFRHTGVRIYPFVKPLKIEVRDDPHPEKRFPRASPIVLSKWHTSEK